MTMCYHNLFRSALQVQPLQANYLVQWIMTLTINNIAANDWSTHRIHSQSFAQSMILLLRDLECGPPRPYSSKNRIWQLLETLKLHHLSHVSWHPCIQHFWDMSCFLLYLYQHIQDTNLEKSSLLNQWKDFSLKFDKCNRKVQKNPTTFQTVGVFVAVKWIYMHSQVIKTYTKYRYRERTEYKYREKENLPTPVYPVTPCWFPFGSLTSQFPQHHLLLYFWKGKKNSQKHWRQGTVLSLSNAYPKAQNLIPSVHGK